MVEYILAVGVSFLFSCIYDLNINSSLSLGKKQDYRFAVLKIVLAVLAGFPFFYLQARRNELGADYQLYANEFVYINSGSGYVHSDSGFQELNRLVFFFGGDYKAMFAVVAFIQTVGVYSLAVSLGVPLSIFSLLYFLTFNYLQSFSLIAQYTAIGIVCLAFSLMLKRFYVPSLVLLAIAATIHSSSYIFFVYFLFYIFLEKTRNKIMLSALFAVAAVIFASVSSKLLPLILKNTRFGVYYERDNTDLNSTSMIVINMFIVLLMIMVFLIETDVRENVCYNFFFSIQFMALVAALLQPVVPLMVRMAMYFSFFEVYSVPLVLQKLSNKQLQSVIFIITLLAFTAWFYLYPVAGNYYQVIPYR